MSNPDKAIEKAARLPSQPAEIPTVPGLPLIGSLLDLVKNPIEFLKQQHAQFGEVFRFHAAHKKFVVLAGVEANRRGVGWPICAKYRV